MTKVKTYDELRRTPPHVTCEHGGSQRACPHCEGLAADQEIERLEAELSKVEGMLRYLVGRLGGDEFQAGQAPIEDIPDMIYAQAMFSERHVSEGLKIRTRERDEARARVAELEAERDRVLGVMRDGPDMPGEDPVEMVRALGLLYIDAVQRANNAEARVAELEDWST